MKTSLNLMRELNESFEKEIQEKLEEKKKEILAKSKAKEEQETKQELKESEQLNEAGEWDENDEEMIAWKDAMREDANQLALNIGGEVKSVRGFDAYQGPYAIVSTPKHGDVEVWFGEDEGTYNVEVAHVGWLTGGLGDISEWLNMDTIPEEFILKEAEEVEVDKDGNKTIRDTETGHAKRIEVSKKTQDDIANEYNKKSTIKNIKDKYGKKEECDSTLKEDEVIEISQTEPEIDYVITDVTELEDTSDGDVQAPDIDALLTMLGESFKEDYGDAIKINILSSSLLENGSFALVDISTPQILKEFEEKHIYDAAVGKNLVLENDGEYYTFKVNSLNGTTRYSKRTKNPIETIREWVETEFLSEAKKEKEEQLAFMKAKTEKETVEAFVNDRPDLKAEKANIEMFIELSKGLDNKDEMHDSIQKRMYGLAAEFPNNIEVTNKDDKYELKFNGFDDIVEILFGKEWVKKAEEELPGNGVKGLNESALPNISEFIYDLDKDKGNAWSAQSYTKDGNGHKIIIVSRNGESENTAEDIKKAVEEKYPKLRGDITENNAGVWFYLQESDKLNESYDQFNIGDIDVVYNPQTQECLYSIESADVHDKKINLSKIPSVETPYDTDTIIKDYIEKQYGPIPQEVEDNKEPEGEALPPIPAEDTTVEVNDTEVVEEAEGDEEIPTPADMGIDTQPAEDAEVEEENTVETGSAYFFKIRPGKAKSGIEDIRQQQKDGVVQQLSSYIVVEEVNLSEADFNEFTSDFSQPRDFLTGVKPLDRKNYAFNVVKVTGEGVPYSVLVDPTGFNYARYVAINDEV